MLERVLVALLAGGHLLLEGVPGLAKTLTIRTLADALDASFRRIQFTPDLVPGDLVGTRIYRPDAAPSTPSSGPVFCNFLLADEINRAPAKVQSALLEVMQERQVTIGRESHPVPRPFLVMATQNPIESEGTYPLPEAQVDRFMMKVVVGYPSAGRGGRRSSSARCGPAAEVRADPRRRRPRGPPGRDAATSTSTRRSSPYAVAIVAATREPGRVRPARTSSGYIAFGASPRGSINLIHAARALALIRGRRYVIPGDVAELAPDVLRHRIVPQLHGPRRGGLGRSPCSTSSSRRSPRRGWSRRSGRHDRLPRDARGPRRGRPRVRAPGPTPEALLRALDVTIGRRIRGLVPGEFRAHDLGGGTELAQVRPYEPGDDVRRIDWNVTARTSVPHVRVHVPERSLTTWLVLDVSPSMTFGTADRRKADVAEGVALAVGHLSTQRGNRLGVLTFGGADDRRAPAARRPGRAAVAALAARGATRPTRRRAGRRRPPPPSGSSPAARPAAGSSCSSPTSAGPRDWLPAAGRRRGRATRCSPSRSATRARTQLPDVGELTLVDAETGREVRVDTSSRTLRHRFAEAAAAERASLATELRRLGVRHLVLSTSGELAPLAARPSSVSGGSSHDLRRPRAPARACCWSRPRSLLYLLVQRRRVALRRPVHQRGPAREPRARRPRAGGATCRRCCTSSPSPRSASRSPGRR